MTIFVEIAKLLLLPVTAHHLGYSEDDDLSAIGRYRVHEASFVTPFRLWSHVSFFCNSEGIRLLPVCSHVDLNGR